MSITVLHSGKRPDNADIQALSELLQGYDLSETAFHRLLERHPALLGAMGYLEFASEVPVPTRDNSGKWITSPGRHHRADIIAARLNVSGNQKAQKFANLIELKGAGARVLNSKNRRPSKDLKDALDQLAEYSEALVAGGLPSIVRNLGWQIWMPSKTVIMGRLAEFESPGQLEQLKQDVLNRHGVQLVLTDEVLSQAVWAKDAPGWSSVYSSFEGIIGLSPPAYLKSSLIVASRGLAGNILASTLLGDAMTTYGNVDVSCGVPEGLVHLDELRLQPIARKLGIPYADAVTGFREFRRDGVKRWGAIKSGVVVAEFNEQIVMAANAEREERNRPRREKARLLRQSERDSNAMKFAAGISEMFPKLETSKAKEIAYRATEPRSGRVGTNPDLVPSDAIWLAVAAYAAYSHLGYTSRREADENRHLVCQLLKEWEG